MFAILFKNKVSTRKNKIKIDTIHLTFFASSSSSKMQINPLNFSECNIAFSSSNCLKKVSNYVIHFLSEMQFSIIQSVCKIE